jgi:hypothetical protein
VGDEIVTKPVKPKPTKKHFDWKIPKNTRVSFRNFDDMVYRHREEDEDILLSTRRRPKDDE